MIAIPVISEPQASGGQNCRGCASGSDQDRKARQLALLRELDAAVGQSRVPSEPGLPAGSTGVDAVSIERELHPDRTVYHLDQAAPLPLLAVLSHRAVGGKHLWIGVEQAVVVVLDELDHEVMSLFHDGGSVAAAVDSLVQRMPPTEALARVSRLVGSLATSGFLRGIEGYTERRSATPERFARFHLTKACQLSCIHCYADSSPHVDRSNELPTERWERVVDEFAENGGERVLFSGGEALLHAGCVPLMTRAKALGLEVTLFSNGLLVPQFAAAIKDTVDQIQISLDGPDEASNDRIRGRNTHKKILRAIDVLLAQGTRVRLGMSVMEQNWEEWKRGFLGFAQRYAATPLEYRLSFGITHYGRGADLRDTLEVSETQPVVDRLLENTGKARGGPRITRHTSGCGYCEQFVVGPDGTVYPCHLLDAPVAHIDDQPVAQLTTTLRKIARLFDVDHTEGCNVCDIRYLCGGTCRVMNGQRTGSRLITTCRQADKDRRYGNLVDLYLQHNAAGN